MGSRWKLRRVGIGSAMKIGGFMGCAAGFMFGVVWGFFMAVFSAAVSSLLDVPATGAGAAALLITPFLAALAYGLVCACAAGFMALFYNIAAGLMGGVDIELESPKSDHFHPMI